MRIQHRIATVLKPLVFEDEVRPRRVKFGVGRGIVLLTNRRRGIQQELGLYESELSRVYRRSIDSRSVAYDIGAGNGREALILARLGAQLVVAFDPDPGYAKVAAANLELNPELAASIRYLPVAFEGVEPGWPAPTFAKIDVDGYEAEVLTRLPSSCERIVVETHSRRLEHECLDLLRKKGYAVELVRNAAWRRIYPEYGRPELNRWLLASRSPRS
jgi:SAM-dependent methyltransferase